MLLAAATLMLATTLSTDTTFSDAAIKRALPREATADPVKETPDKAAKKPALVMKALKEVQRRSCRTTPRTGPPPSSSWPVRGQTLMTMCS